MNKLLTFPGIQPIYLGDIDFLQASVRDAFSQLLRGLTGIDNPKCIIAPATSNKDGVICIDGEILPLKYSPVTARTCYQVMTSSSGERVMKSGEIRKCWEERYVIGINGLEGAQNNARYFKNIADLMVRNIPSQVGHSEINEGAITTIMSIVNDGSVVSISGSIQVNEAVVTSDIVAGKLTDLPVGSWMFPIVYESYSQLKMVPAKLSVVYDEAEGSNKCTIKTNDISFKQGDFGTFSLIIS